MLRKILITAALPVLIATSVEAQENVQFIGSSNPNSAFSRIVVAGNTIYLSGMLGTGGGPEIEDQTRATLESIRDALAEVGATMDDVVKCTVFMSDLSERPRLNPVYNSFFPNHRPARSAVGVDLGGPKVEIECIAVRPG